MSLRETIDRAPMTKFQVMVVALCLAMNIVEGFDILVMAFAASAVAGEWQLSGSQIGLLLSAGLIGMVVGSAGVAPSADRIGRRPLTLLCLGVATVGMTLSALTTSFAQLGLCRLLTGIGVGGVMASLPVIITEYSNRRGRGTSIAFFAVGLPLGGVIGGTIAALVTAEFGWRATFALGAVLSIATIAVVHRLLPESLDYLVTRRPAGALDKINAIVVRMRIEPLTELPDSAPSEVRGVRAAILSGRNGVRTGLVWIMFFSLLAGLYFASGWTPRLLEQSGLSAQQGISGGILLNLGGVAGTLLITVLALRFSSTVLAAVTIAGAGVAFLCMTLALGNLSATLVTAIAVGLTLNANGAVLHAIAPAMYPPSVRTTGMGWASAAGRIGGILAPIVAGVLVDRGWTGTDLFRLFAIPLFVAAVATLLVSVIRPATTPSEDPTVSVDPQASV
jgi:benzoate transport